MVESGWQIMRVKVIVMSAVQMLMWSFVEVLRILQIFLAILLTQVLLQLMLHLLVIMCPTAQTDNQRLDLEITEIEIIN